MSANPYKIGWFIDNKKIVETKPDVHFSEPYFWCKLEDGSYRDTSIDDEPIEKQNIHEFKEPPKYEVCQVSPIHYRLNDVCLAKQNEGWEIAGQLNPFRCNQGKEWCMVVFKRRIKQPHDE